MSERVLAGTAALITGGGSGIGLAAARHLLRDGASVTLAGRTQDRLDAAVAELEAPVHDAEPEKVVPIAGRVALLRDLHYLDEI